MSDDRIITITVNQRKASQGIDLTDDEVSSIISTIAHDPMAYAAPNGAIVHNGQQVGLVTITEPY